MVDVAAALDLFKDHKAGFLGKMTLAKAKFAVNFATVPAKQLFYFADGFAMLLDILTLCFD
jgi:hypothetical protein